MAYYAFNNETMHFSGVTQSAMRPKTTTSGAPVSPRSRSTSSPARRTLSASTLLRSQFKHFLVTFYKNLDRFKNENHVAYMPKRSSFLEYLPKITFMKQDTGSSVNPLIDIGQMEGAFVMSLGLWLTEQV